MELINVYGSFTALIVIGYCLAQFASLNSSGLFTVVRYVFIPIILFKSLSQGMPPKTLVIVLLTGIGVAALGPLLMAKLGRYLNTSSPGNMLPNVAYFTIPMIGICFGAKGLGTASSFLLGVYLVQEGKNASQIDIKKIVKEPILIAAILAFVVSYFKWKIPYLDKVMLPLFDASFVVIALYLGCSLQKVDRMNMESMKSIGVQLAFGLLVATTVISILGLKGIVAKSIMLCALAPPGGSAISEDSEEQETLSVLLCLLIMGLITLNGFEPWDFRFF